MEPFLSLKPIIIYIFFFFTSFLSAHGQDNEKYRECGTSLYSCGRVQNLSYPFWGENKRPQFCGHPDYELHCENNEYSILRTAELEFRVLEVSQETNTIKMARLDLWDDLCSPKPLNTTLNQVIFGTFPPTVGNFTLFYNCTIQNQEPNFSIPTKFSCPMMEEPVYYATDSLLDTNWRSNVTGTCRSVQVPAFKSAVDEINSAGEENKELVLEALKQGFDLNYVDFKLCNLCRESGGECGSNISSQFLCICREGIRDSVCHVPERRDWGLKAGIGVGAACFAIVIMCIGFFFYQRNYKKRNPHSSSFSTSFFRNISSDLSSVKDVEKGGSTYLGVHVFTYEELVEATNNFDPSKELGDGGFGTVYYGKLQDGRGVAVKRLYESNYRRVEQFMNEVEILAHVRHPNLVQLYGCTSRHSRELLLVYEYISNGTVADHLHGEKANAGALPWPIRLNIAVESALALTYLHATDIIHRDVKTNNILLDNNFSVKVADFGLSRLFPSDVTHISTAPQGTPGYVDPEYHHCYQLTSKSDVFSFGVVLVELISSMPAVDITRHRHDINLSTMAINRIQNHALHEIVDLSLGFDSDSTVRKMITAVAELAFQCLQNEKDMRPSMNDVLEELRAIQSRDYSPEMAEKKDVVTDEAVLLKNGPLTLSPDSVTANWVSRNTTPNASG